LQLRALDRHYLQQLVGDVTDAPEALVLSDENRLTCFSS